MDVLLFSLFTSFLVQWETRSQTNSQQAPSILLSPLTQHWGYTHAWHIPGTSVVRLSIYMDLSSGRKCSYPLSHLSRPVFCSFLHRIELLSGLALASSLRLVHLFKCHLLREVCADCHMWCSPSPSYQVITLLLHLYGIYNCLKLHLPCPHPLPHPRHTLCVTFSL